MGPVSRNTTLCDFDDYATYQACKAAAAAAGIGDLVERVERGYSERTPSGGVHWFYRSDVVRPSTKLARRLRRPDEMRAPGDRWKVLIETKGIGGYAVLAPSNGRVHPSGRPYEVLQGSPATILWLREDEQEELWRLARLFDETPADDGDAPVREARPPSGATRPGDRFAEQTAWHSILVPHGWQAVWTHGAETAWRRPGKSQGISATTNYRGSDLFYPFTTSTVFEANRGYGKFAAYALLEHRGDYRAAARELAARGFAGDAATPDLEDEAAPEVDPETGEVRNAPRWALIRGRDLRRMALPPIAWVLEDMIPRGRYVVLSGESGLGKSWWALLFALCAGTGRPFLGRATAPVKALYVDEENGIQEAQRRLRALADGLGIPEDDVLPVDFYIDESIKLDKAVDVDALAGVVQDEGYTTIISDSLIRFFDGNENRSDEVAKFHGGVDKVRRLTGVDWVMLQHLNKAGRDGGQVSPGDRIRGSGEFKAHADVHIQLRGMDGPGNVVVSVEKLRGGMRPPDVVYRLEGDTRLDEPVTMTVLGDTAAALGAEQAALMAACDLLEERGALTVSDLVRLLRDQRGIPSRTAERVIKIGRTRGAIRVARKEGKHVYLTIGVRPGS